MICSGRRWEILKQNKIHIEDRQEKRIPKKMVFETSSILKGNARSESTEMPNS